MLNKVVFCAIILSLQVTVNIYQTQFGYNFLLVLLLALCRVSDRLNVITFDIRPLKLRFEYK